jgi:hypothetical protein
LHTLGDGREERREKGEREERRREKGEGRKKF